MKLFYATGNESKIKNMRYRLSGYEVELVTPKDLGIHIRVEETGAQPTENARLMARDYFEQTGLPTLAADSGLYIDGIPEELQPGLHVRRVNGRTLSEDEMISRYSSLAAEYGGILRARYMTGLVMICRGREYTAKIPDDDVLITGEPNSNRRHRGNPLDVVTVCPANGKYFNDCSLEELSVLAGSFDRKCIRFLQESGIIPEKSCGGIVCTIRNGRIEYLLIEESGGFHSFPKGHMETGESERETAIREIREETGLKLDLIEGFREVDEYIPAENAGVCRQVVYFLAEYSEQLPRIEIPEEVRSIKSLDLEAALALLEHEGPRRILLAADRYIRRKRVVVLPYDEAWNRDFIRISTRIKSALEGLAIRIEHVGSTSVPGLSAKPIIDLDVVIEDGSWLEAVITALGGIGYRHEGDLGIAGREAFAYEGKEHLRKHHLYVCPSNSAELKRHLAFRDYLRARPEAAREYGRIKEEGAALYPYDIEKYIEHKSPFIERIYAEIGI